MRDSLKQFIEEKIIPLYDAFDKGHRRDHALYVMQQGLYLSSFYDVDEEIVYTACACHDLGLREDRKTHHLVSGRIIREELPLGQWFTPEQIETIACAAEDHRASLDHDPRTIYGKIVAEADRQIIPETVIRRTVQFGLKSYPELDREGHWERTLQHLNEKYADGGYLKLWIPESPNAGRLEELRDIIRDRSRLRKIFERIYAGETGNLSCIHLAAGCFWGAQKYFKLIDGVVDTQVGFINGNPDISNPSYEEVYSDRTGYAECVKVEYDKSIVDLERLIRLYFRIIDPTSLNRQGEDSGTRYRTGIYYSDEKDIVPIRRVYDGIARNYSKPLAVELGKMERFYPAEEYHQDYLDKNPGGYCHILPELFEIPE